MRAYARMNAARCMPVYVCFFCCSVSYACPLPRVARAQLAARRLHLPQLRAQQRQLLWREGESGGWG
jgi:hypothetical protein